MSDLEKLLQETEQFKLLCQDVLPLANKIRDVVEKHGIKPDCLATLTLSPDGYMVFSTHASKLQMLRLATWEKAKVNSVFLTDVEETVVEEDK